MQETYYAGVYWGPRKESAADCARRTEFLFRLLEQCDPSFDAWFRAGKVARGQPGVPVDSRSLEQLEQLFERGRNRTDFKREVIEDLGFGLMVWNQGDERSRLSVHCGVFSPYSHNVCLLDLSTQRDVAERLLNTPLLARILECLAMAFEPDWGIATSSLTFELFPKTKAFEVDVGWLTYLSRQRGPVPPLPAPVRIQPVGSLGTLVLLTPERFSVSNPEHVSLALRVHELLGRAGLLRPQP